LREVAKGLMAMQRIQEKLGLCVTKMRSRKGFTLIELLVVMGIAALLMTLAATSFFGASRRDTVTKSRNQFCDVLRLARQQACVAGKKHVVICWNATTKIKVGDKEVDGGKQGRYAIFEYVGNVWPQGRQLCAPFGVQREAFATLTRKSRLININDPDQTKFIRLTRVRGNATETNREQGQNMQNISAVRLDYEVAGSDAGGFEARGDNLWVATVDSQSPMPNEPFPLGIRTSQTYALPKEYGFDKDRVVFVFSEDGRCETTSSVKASHSVAKNLPTFSVSVSSEGVVEPGKIAK
jgi:prepilin-type N-terminal cleavage/methylation domain-containing protein